MNITRDDKQVNLELQGPLNALEADRYVEGLRFFAFEEMGGPQWVSQHEWLQQLNMQAHINASQARDEFVVEALVLHEKLPLLVRELIACELWKQNVYPLLKEYISKRASVKGYLLLFNEAVIANLLEAVLYHPHACEAAADVLPELVDYCHRKLVWLLSFRYTPPPPRPTDKEQLKRQLLKEMEEEDHLETQRKTIDLSTALYALSILRFLSEQVGRLPLAVTSKLLDSYDVLMLLCPLLESKPWEHRAKDGTLRRFVQGQWVVCSDADRRAMAKSEAQVWLTVYALMAEPEVRRKYELNTFRKNTLLRVRGFLNETTVDQLPLLADLQRALDELSMMEVPAAANSKPAYLLEALPELREELSRGVNWASVADQMREGTLNESEEERRATARRLAALYDADGIDAMVEGGGRDEPPPMHYFVEVAIIDAEGTEVARLTCESEDTQLGEAQQAFRLSNDHKRVFLPADRCFSIAASLNSGQGKPWEVKGPLELADDKKKQWVQIGFDPFALRLQLHFLRDASASAPPGFHLIHCRATPPLLQRLTLSFMPEGEGAQPLAIRASGRGIAAQTPFIVDTVDTAVRVPRACAAKAALECGGMVYETEEVPLELGVASQMVWRQLGKFSTELRVQIKLAPASGGYALTAVRVTAPPGMREVKPADAVPPPALVSEIASAAPSAAVVAAEVQPASPAASTTPPRETVEGHAAGWCNVATSVSPEHAPAARLAADERPDEAVSSAPVPAPHTSGAAEREAASRAAVAAAKASEVAKNAAKEAAAASARAVAAEAACDAEPEDGGVVDITDELEKAAEAKEAARKAAARASEAAAAAKAAVAAAARAADVADAAEVEAGTIPQSMGISAKITDAAEFMPTESLQLEPTEPATPAPPTLIGSLCPKHGVTMKGQTGARTLVVLVDLPGIQGMRELDVELSTNRLKVSGGDYVLDLELPTTIDVDRASAKFSTKASQLKVTLAEA